MGKYLGSPDGRAQSINKDLFNRFDGSRITEAPVTSPRRDPTTAVDTPRKPKNSRPDRTNGKRSNPRKHREKSNELFSKMVEKPCHSAHPLFRGLLDRTMRFNTRETVKDNLLEEHFRIFGGEVTVQSMADDGLMTHADYRTIYALIDLYRLHHKSLGSGERLGNTFTVNVADLARLLNYASPNSMAARKHINLSLERLQDTRFVLSVHSSEDKEVDAIMSKLGMIQNPQTFRFIQALKPSQVSRRNRRSDTDASNIPWVTKWEVRLDGYLTQHAINDKGNVAVQQHRDAMVAGGSMIQGLYSFLMLLKSHRPPESTSGSVEVYCKPFSELNLTIRPGQRAERFESTVLGLMGYHGEDHSEHAKPTNELMARLFGLDLCLFKPSVDEGWWVSVAVPDR